MDARYSRAYRPLFRILFAETRDGCSFTTGLCLYVSPVVRDGDSVITIPPRVRLNVPGVGTYADVVRESQANRRTSLIEARELAKKWAGVAPNDPRPHQYHGRALLELGEYSAAATELELAATLGTPDSRRSLFWDRFEALVKSDRGKDARRVLDEAETDRARFDSLTRNRPVIIPRPTIEALLAAGDTAGARRRLASLDSTNAPHEGWMRIAPVGREHLESAKYHLALGDTAVAEAQLAEIEGILYHRPFQYSPGLVFSDLRPWMGLAWSLKADVAAARGRADEAVRLYRRVIGLWEGGDPEVDPVVEHARTRLRSLSAR